MIDTYQNEPVVLVVKYATSPCSWLNLSEKGDRWWRVGVTPATKAWLDEVIGPHCPNTDHWFNDRSSGEWRYNGAQNRTDSRTVTLWFRSKEQALMAKLGFPTPDN